MKKFIAYLLVALMCVSGLAACGQEEKVNEDLQAAADYVYAMYKDAGSVTANDYERVAQVMIGGVAYAVDWTADTDAVKITVADKIATIDVDEKSAETVEYVLTATIKDADGNTATKEFKYTIPKFEGYDKIVKDAYALEVGAAMEGTFTLEGVITAVNTAYSADYKNVTVTIQVGDLKDMPIMCYRLKDGDGVTAADTIKVGDTITVTGTLKNYNGTIEFDAGCTLDKVVVGEGPVTPEPEVPTVPSGATQEEIVDIAYTLEAGQQLTDKQTLTGVITKVDTEYSADYQNVTVTIQVGSKSDKLIMCYRMKGDGADKIAVGDTVTVTGILKNYNGTIEFDAGCTLDSYKAASSNNTPGDSQAPSNGGDDTPANTQPSNKLDTPEKIVNAAYALEQGASLDGTYTLTGVITRIDQVYDASYKNVTVTIQVDSLKDKPIMCYRLSGTGADIIGVNDKITVTGVLTNYNGTIEFTSGCTLDSYVDNPDPKPTYSTAKEIIDAAYKLEVGATLEGGPYTLTGVITSVDTEYSDQYKNVTVTIVVDGMTDKPIMCFRLKGTGADTIKVGDTITVTGSLINYNGTIEFTSGCQLQ